MPGSISRALHVLIHVITLATYDVDLLFPF